MTVITLRSIFGCLDEIGELIRDHSFSKTDVKDINSTNVNSLHLDLAPSYGELTSGVLKSMDDHLKIMITGTMKLLSTMEPQERTWDNVISSMMQNPFLQPSEGNNIHAVDKLIKKGINVFKFDGSPKTHIVKEVQTWFAKLVDDQDVLKSTNIDIKIFANIVAQTGVIIDSVQDFFMKDEKHEKTVVDISVLRFPDIDHSYFKVYHIKLTAWSNLEHFLVLGEYQNGITGEYHARNFEPRPSVIDGLRAETKKKAIEQAENILI